MQQQWSRCGRLLPRFGQHGQHLVRLGGDQDHANAAVEYAQHFRTVHIAGAGQPFEDRGHGPCLINNRIQPVGQHARQVARQAATGNVGGPMQQACFMQGQNGAHVQARGFQKSLAQRAARCKGCGVGPCQVGIGHNAAHERKAVGMHTGGGQGDQCITRGNACGQQGAAFGCPNGKTGQIVVAIGVHAGHFCCFTTDKGAAGVFAAFGNAAHNLGSRGNGQATGGKVVEKNSGSAP